MRLPSSSIRSGVTGDGRLLVIDVGGGTMDVAVVTSSLGRKRVDLYATGGYALGGDKFTEVLVARIQAEVEALNPGHTRTRQDDTLIWQRAENAKIALSDRPRAVVALGGIAGLGDATFDVTREWYEHETRGLIREIRERVENVFRTARLVLDRGDEFDPAPGTIEFEEKERGYIRRLTQVGLEDDGVSHLDGVIIVGGASRMPKLTEEFERIFGDKLRDPVLLGIEPIETVVLGLSRNESLSGINRMYPNWGVSLVFSTGAEEREVEVYEPFAPAFAVRAGRTSTYRLTVPVPENGALSVALAFRQVGGKDGIRWPEIPLTSEMAKLNFRLDLFGSVRLEDSSGIDVYGDDDPVRRRGRPKPPWRAAEADRVAEWLPPWAPRKDWHSDLPEWDLRNDN